MLRLTHNVDLDLLQPRMPDARALTFRRLATRDSARIDMLTNHAFAGMLDCYAYSFIPLLRRVAKKAGFRVAAPYDNSHPEEWLVTFADRPFLPRGGRVPTFKTDAPAGSACGTLMCKTDVAFFPCFYIAQLSIKNAVEMSLAFRLPAPDRVTFAEAQTQTFV